jgi:hypothetical protein
VLNRAAPKMRPLADVDHVALGRYCAHDDRRSRTYFALVPHGTQPPIICGRPRPWLETDDWGSFDYGRDAYAPYRLVNFESIDNVSNADLESAQKDAWAVSALGPAPTRMEGTGRRPLLPLGASIKWLLQVHSSRALRTAHALAQ